ncbi:cystinosin homolog isoform X2 [Cylas formicarius]|nr:cystinosin homolog isoform X2 [Cylas formicarius]
MNFLNASLLPALISLLISVKCIDCDITLSVHDVSLKVDHNATVQLILNGTGTEDRLHFVVQHGDIAEVVPSDVVLTAEVTNITVIAKSAGRTQIYANSTNNSTNVGDVYLRVTVYLVDVLDTVSTAIGWLYFVAWSVSFYPQIYINWSRKSVVGLNFDFLVLNIVGFTLYSIFNLGLYYIPEIKEEYSNRYPRGLNPVQVNDIFFAVHATAASLITIFQCFIYEREGQRVSTTARAILGFFGLFILISIVLSATAVIHWLDFLYYCSYVKLTITLIKYIPQAYMNYKRKSTVGWSIGNILLDFTGGILSMLQMILNSYNYDDWVSIFGDPTKFGLGLFSVAFDIFFILQHYVFYRHTQYIMS